MNNQLNSNQSAYYQHSGSVPLASKLSYKMRGKMFRFFMERLEPNSSTTVLDVGVTSDSFFQESNYFEKLYPYPAQITCVGTEDGSHLMAVYPGLKYLRVAPGEPLPFQDRQFDIVFSNATVEHVGSHEDQKAFLEEICRVGKAFFVTTPNRWFPIEHHTGLPLMHYLPPALFRRIIRHTKYSYWADEAALNILTASELKSLFPSGSQPEIYVAKLFGVGSNLVAYGRTRS